MKYQYPSTRMTFKGTLRYSVSKNSKVLQFEHELSARHLLRPLTMSTEQFGEKWTSTSSGVRKHVALTSRRSCEDLADVIATYIHFEVIDIKGMQFLRLVYPTRFVVYDSYPGVCERIYTCANITFQIPPSMRLWCRHSFPFVRMITADN